MAEFDCVLEMDTDEVEYFLETGEIHKDLDKALEFLLAHAVKHDKATCTFTVYKSGPKSEDS